MKHKYFLTKKKWYYEEFVDYKYMIISIFVNDKMVDFDIDPYLCDSAPIDINFPYGVSYTVESEMLLGHIISTFCNDLVIGQEIETKCEVTLGNYVYVGYPDIVVAHYALNDVEFELGSAIDYFITIPVLTQFRNNTIIRVVDSYPFGNINCYVGGVSIEPTLAMELQEIDKMYANIAEPIRIRTDFVVEPPIFDFLNSQSVEFNITIPDYEVYSIIDCHPILRFSGLAGLKFYELQGLKFKDLYLKTW